jgi:hypothetical protein
MIFGPFSQTFLAYRLEKLLDLPKENESHSAEKSSHFYGWECLSLKLKNRTFDMVIKDP